MTTPARSNTPPVDREIIDSQDERLSIHTHSIRLTQANLPYQAVTDKRLPAEKHFAVYADQIILDNSLQNPGRNIELYAREIVITKPIMLDVAGAYADKDFLPGDLPVQQDAIPGAAGTAGADATDGGNGGSIIICARRLLNQADSSKKLSVADIAAIGTQAFAEHSAKVANVLKLAKFEMGRTSMFGNKEMVIYLDNAQLAGLSGVQLDSSGFDGSNDRVSLRFSVPKLAISGTTNLTGNQRLTSNNFGYQADVSATLSADGELGPVQVTSSLLMDSPISFNIPFINAGGLSSGILNHVVDQFAKVLQQQLFEPLLNIFNVELQTASLRLLANGGRGGRGQDGHPGVRGEPGADGAKPSRSGVRTSGGYGFPEEAMGKSGKQGGRAGSAGRSGNGGIGGRVELNVTEPAQLAVFYSAAGGDGGAEASPGDHGKGGKGGKGALTKMMDEKGKPLPDMHATDGKTGPVGPAAKFNGAMGAGGEVGLPLHFNNKLFAGGSVPDYSLAALAQTLSLSQLLITQNYTDLGFLNAKNAQDLQPVADSYEWLISINQPFTGPATDIDSGQITKPEQAVRASMHNSAVVVLMRLQQGLDYFGHSYNWTPVLNLKSLVARTGEIISLGKVIEDQYQNYLHKAKTDRERMDAFRKAKQEIDRKLADTLTEIKKLGPQIDSFQTEVGDYTEDLRRQRTVLLQGNMKFKDQLIKHLREENALDFDDFLDILGTVVSTVGGVATGVGGIKSAFDAVKKAEEFSKKVKSVVEIFKKAKATIGSISKAYNSIKDRIDESNPNGAKIIVDADDFDKLLKEYLGKFPAACELRAAMDYYLELSQARNMAAYNYTALVGQLLSLQMQHDQLYDGIQHINAEIAVHQDNLLPVYTAYLRDAYEDVQRNLLRNIYQETRAYEYWALESRQLETSNLNIATQAATHQRLIADIDGFRENNESFSDFNQKIIISAERFTNEFAALQTSRSLAFGLDIRDELGFLNMRYIIARNFKLAFPDIDGGSNVLYINLIHSGRAVMNNNTDLGAPDAVRIFSHRPRVKLYKIDYSDSENTAGGNFGEGGQGYIGLSPFSNWRIDFDLRGNEWLDLKQLKTVELTFEGRFLGPGRRLR